MYWCTKSEARIAALLRILAGCAARGGRIPAVVFDRRATKHPAKIRAALRVGAAPVPRRVAGSLNRTSAIRLASALRVIRWRFQRCYTSLRLGALLGMKRCFADLGLRSLQCFDLVYGLLNLVPGDQSAVGNFR